MPRLQGKRRGLRAVRLLERACLGRACVHPASVVASALAIAADARWCMGCGRHLSFGPPMPRQVAAGQGPRCVACMRGEGFAAFVRMARYRPPIDGVLRRSKHRAEHGVLRELGRRLGQMVSDRMATPAGGWCVVPVPASPLRRLLRGIDHSTALARGVAQILGVPVTHAVRGCGSTRQASLARQDRLRRRHAGRGAATARIRGRHVLIVDDIRTTGATLRSVRRVLQDMGAASVSAAVVAVAEVDA